jgi:competence protein ComEA
VARGAILLLLLLLGMLALQSRTVLFVQKEPPAFFVEPPGTIWVALGEGFPDPGVHQFSDELDLLGVIKLTTPGAWVQFPETIEAGLPLESGEGLQIRMSGTEVIEIKRFWMPSEWRMALAVPLHPDRMTEADWQALPGIGPRMAQRIEEDRQRNGDFIAFQELQRVRGIGPQRLKAWERYFQ